MENKNGLSGKSKKQAIQPIKEEVRYKYLFESMAQGVVYQDKTGAIIEANAAALKILGLTYDQLCGKTSFDPSWKAIQADGSDFLGETHPSIVALKTGFPVKDTIMGVFNSRENNYRWIRINAFPIFNDTSKEPIQVVTTFDDITENIRIEQELIEKEQRYRSLVEESPNAIFINIENSIVLVNKKFMTLMGATNEHELLGKSPFDIFHPAYHELIKERINSIKEIGKAKPIEEQIVTLQGKVIDVEVYAGIFEMDGKKAIHVILNDITERTKAEQELKESEEKFYKIFQNSPNSIILTRVSDYEIVNANEATTLITGYSLNELIGKKQSQINIWKSVDQCKKYNDLLIKNGEVKEFEAKFITKSGENRIWKTSGEIIQISNKKYILGIIHDITELRLTETALKSQSEFINTLIENQPAGIVACDAEGKLALFNKTAKEWHGIDILKIPQEQWAENYGLYKEDGSTILDIDDIPLIKAFRGEKVDNYEIVIKAVGQKPRLVFCNGASFFDQKGTRLGAVVVMNDITQQRLIENNLKKSEELTNKALAEVERSEFLLNEAGRMSKIGAWEFDLATQKTRWSNQVFQLHGIPIGEVPDFDFIMGSYIDGSEEILRKSIEECITHRKTYELELRFQNIQKEKLWVKAIGYPIVNNHDEMVSLRGVVQDITEFKHSEIIRNELNERLLIEQERLLEAQTIAKVGSWTTNLPNLEVNWSNETHQIFGTDPESFNPVHTDFLELVHPNDREKVDTAFVDSFNDSLPHEIEHRILTADNKIKFVVERWKVIRDKEGNPIRVTGTSQDITNTKKYQQEIEESEKRYKTLFENQPTIIWEEDFSDLKKQFDKLKKKGVEDFNNYFEQHPEVVKELAAMVKVVEVNSTGIEILEADSKEDIVKNIPFYFNSDEAWLKFKEELVALAHGEVSFQCEIPIRTVKGNPKNLLLKLIVHPDCINDLKKVLVTFQDITELKKVQSEIINTKELLETITNNLPGAVIQYKIKADGSDTLTYVSSGSNDIWGIKPEDAMRDNQQIWNQIDKNYINKVNESIKESYLDLGPWNVEFKSKLPNGKNKWIQGIGTPKKNDDGSVIWNSIMLDVTHRKEADENIKVYQDSLKKLTIDLSLTEEKQRKQIASNIHDHLSQSLVISKMKLRDFIKKNNLSLNVQELNTVIKHLSDAIENSRKITYDLSPPVLYDLGLIETMYWFTDKTQKEHSIKVSFITNQENIKLSDKELILIFRTIQELINNTIKHAKATEIFIKFNIQPAFFEIFIDDDGVGFNVNLGPKNGNNKSGFGLFSVKERIQNLFGTIEFDSVIGKGTHIKIVFPINKSKSKD